MSEPIERIDEVVHLLSKGSTQQAYFFSQVTDPRWLGPLKNTGLFLKPYQAVRSADGVRYPSWPQADYLMRVASTEPDIVFDVLMEMESTDNERVWGQLVGVALELPPAMAATWSQRLSRWVGEQPWLWATLSEQAGELCAQLVEAGEPDAALGIADAMLALVSEPDAAMSTLTQSTRRRPRSKLNPHELHEFVQLVGVPLSSTAGDGYCRLLLARLKESLTITLGKAEATEDYSEIWRPMVAEVEGFGHDDVRDEFIDALRDALIVTSDASRAEATAILNEMWTATQPTIVRRIALYVMSQRPQVFENAIESAVRDPSSWADTSIWPEFAAAAQAYCSAAAANSVAQVIALATSGLETEALKRARDEAENGLSEDDLRRYADNWLHRRLEVLEQWLGDEDRDRLAALRESRGPLDDALTRRSKTETWVGPTSPLNPEQLASMSCDDVLRFLFDWRPSGEWMSPSFEGLARSLQIDVKDRLDEYLHHVDAINELHPAYVNAVLQAIRDVQEVQPALWTELVAIGESVLSKNDDAPVEDDGDGWDYTWRSVRRTVASALNHALERRPVSVPVDLAERVWKLISVLAEDPDPTPEHEAQYGGSNMDPLTLAINTTRGTAMEAATAYVVWRRLSAETLGIEVSMDDLPEVATLLVRHADVQTDPSLAVRAAIGLSLGRLAWFDERWLSEHIELFLPRDVENRPWWEVAWGAFLNYARPFGDALTLFRGSYELSIDLMQQASPVWPAHDWREKAGQHLLSFVLWGRIAPNDELVDRFLSAAPAKVSGSALGFLGEVMRDVHQVDPDAVNNAQQIWEISVKKGELHFAQTQRPPEGTSNFDSWFGAERLDREWRIEQLVRSLMLYRKVENGYQVVRLLPGFAADYPVQSVRALRLILRSDADRFVSSGTYDAIAETVRLALVAGGDDAKTDAKAIVDQLVQQGNYRARELLT